MTNTATTETTATHSKLDISMRRLQLQHNLDLLAQSEYFRSTEDMPWALPRVPGCAFRREGDNYALSDSDPRMLFMVKGYDKHNELHKVLIEQAPAHLYFPEEEGLAYAAFQRDGRGVIGLSRNLPTWTVGLDGYPDLEQGILRESTNTEQSVLCVPEYRDYGDTCLLGFKKLTVCGIKVYSHSPRR